MIKGVVFDFNGTLYQDHDIMRKSWSYAFDSIKPKDSKEKYSEWKRPFVPTDYMLSKLIYDHFNIRADDNMINRLSEKEEKEYKRLAISRNKNTLIKGADMLLDYLKDHDIPYCIASMAPRGNFDFYLDYLHLNKWFSYENIVYDNGNYLTKLSQVKEAARRMGIDPKDCLVIEDTPENIKQIINEIKESKFIYLNSKNKEYISKEILQEIKDFSELDYKIFNN